MNTYSRFKSVIIKLHFSLTSLYSRIVTKGYYWWFINLAKSNVETGINPVSENNIIVSFTTLSHRAKYCLPTIQSLLTQTIKPNKIILWITESEKTCFNNLQKKQLRKLMKLKKAGLEILKTSDIGPLTKFLPAKELFPNALIVTADDDIIYPKRWLQDLYESYLKEPNCIHCYRAHNMLFNKNGALKQYNSWGFESKGIQGPSLDLFPTGVYGVLYAPQHLDENVLDKEKYKMLSYKNDDVWLKAMSLKKGVLCKKVRKNTKRFFELNFSEKAPLNQTNVHSSNNDIYIKTVWSHYFNLK